jgi:hypothetical protein
MFDETVGPPKRRTPAGAGVTDADRLPSVLFCRAALMVAGVGMIFIGTEPELEVTDAARVLLVFCSTALMVVAGDVLTSGSRAGAWTSS